MGRVRDLLGGLFADTRPPLVRESEIHPDPRYDADDESLRAVLSSDDGDVDRHRAARACRGLVKRNPMARRILRLNEDYVVGSSVQVRIDLDDESRQEEVQKELDRWRRSGKVNTTFWRRVYQALVTDGELAIRMVPHGRSYRPVLMDTTGMASGIETESGELVALKETGGQVRTWKVRNSLEELGEDAAGEVLFFAHGGGRRGVPELLPLISRLQWEDEISRLEIARAKALKRWFWKVTVEGATEPELEELNEKYSTAPRTGSVRWTNEKVSWDAVTTQVGSYETAAFLRSLRGTIAGGAGHPLHWHGDGGDANLATATAMGTPSHRQMERFQGEFREIVEAVYGWALELLAEAGRIGEVDQDAVSWDVTLPEVDPRDFEVGTRSVLQAVTAAEAARDAGFLTFNAAQRIVREVIQNVTGVELLEADLGEEPEEDPEPPAPPEVPVPPPGPRPEPEPEPET